MKCEGWEGGVKETSPLKTQVPKVVLKKILRQLPFFAWRRVLANGFLVEEG